MKSKKHRLNNVQVSNELFQRVTRYCEESGKNRLTFIKECIIEKLNIVEPELLESKTKEELIKMLL